MADTTAYILKILPNEFQQSGTGRNTLGQFRNLLVQNGIPKKLLAQVTMLPEERKQAAKLTGPAGQLDLRCPQAHFPGASQFLKSFFPVPRTLPGLRGDGKQFYNFSIILLNFLRRNCIIKFTL